MGGKVVVCLRLLKPFTRGKKNGTGAGRGGGASTAGVSGADDEGGDDGDEAEDEGGADAGSGGPNLLVEVSLERQMLDLIARAGPGGINNSKVRSAWSPLSPQPLASPTQGLS